MLVVRPRVVAVPAVLLFAAVVLAHHGDAAQIVLGLALAALLVIAVLTELQSGRLPDLLLAAAAATAVVLGMLVDSGGQIERLLCAVAAAGFVLLVALASPGSAGMDAVKLAAVLGLFLGREVAVALLIAVALSIAVAIARAAGAQRAGPSRAGTRMAPHLVIAAFGALVFGGPLVDGYLDAF